nr:unnamed protein product [Digitaria exilis]
MASGGVTSDDVPILQTENLTSNVKSIYYRSLCSSLFLLLPYHALDPIWGCAHQNPSVASMASSMLRSGHRLFLRRQRLTAAFSTASAEELIDVRKLPTDYDPSTFDPSSPSRPPPSDRVWRLVEDVSSLTLAESAALSSLLLRRLDIPSAPPIAILNSAAGLGGVGGATAGAAGEKAAAAAEKTVFELRLEAFDAASKIKVIKEIRSFTDLGLKEAKDLVEKAPAVIKGGVSKEEAEAIVEKMKAVGAKVVMD